MSSTQKIMNWINVKDEMPEPGKDVLVCNSFGKKKNIWIACSLSDVMPGTWQKKGSNAGYLEHVVAWMPLPELPKMETENERDVQVLR